jgi:curved DNA-binding protein CbpA
MSLLHGPGDLSRTPLAAVLLEALNLRASGVLEVAHGGGTSRLWFRDGRPVGAQVFAGFRPLGLMLLQAGRIDVDTLSKSLVRMAESGRPQGEILLEMGAVSAEDVARALAEQQAGYIGLLAALDAGAFAFDGVAAVPEWTRGSRLSPLRTIVDALARPQAEALVAAALEPAALDGVRLSGGGRPAAEAVDWAQAERALVLGLETPAPLEAAVAAPGVAPERARALVAALLLLGLAVPAEAGGTGSIALALEPEALAPAAAAAAEAPAAPPAASRPTPAVAAPPSAAPAAPPGAPAPRRSDPAEARARRQRLLQQAIRNMGVGPFAGRDGGRDAAPAAPAPGAPPPPAPAPAGPRPGGTTHEATLRDALLAAIPRVRERDLFVRLGVPETAGREEVKKAFLALARQFHPDRFASPALADLAVPVRDFFAAVNEAYEVLSDDRKRTEYLANRRGQAAAHAEAARVDFLKGEACLRTRDFQRARAFLEAAVRAEPRPEYVASLALACFSDPQRKDKERARRLLAEATKERGCDRAFYVAGLLACDDGDDAAAERHFRAALEANPRNADAQRELRRVEGRRGRG